MRDGAATTEQRFISHRHRGRRPLREIVQPQMKACPVRRVEEFLIRRGERRDAV
jgi:hypothetical protein